MEEKKSFKVNDKRRFTDTGTVKEGKERVIEPEETIINTTSSETEEKKTEYSIDFTSYVMSMANQALMHLGEIEPPEGFPVTVNREVAQHIIDTLAMINEKTEGNLDAKEKAFIESVLHELRMRYVASSN